MASSLENLQKDFGLSVCCNQMKRVGLVMWRDALWDDTHLTLLCFCKLVQRWVCLSMSKLPFSCEWRRLELRFLGSFCPLQVWQLCAAPKCRGVINMSQLECSFVSLCLMSCVSIYLVWSHHIFTTLFLYISLIPSPK